jgi:hypothetical protein
LSRGFSLIIIQHWAFSLYNGIAAETVEATVV